MMQHHKYSLTELCLSLLFNQKTKYGVMPKKLSKIENNDIKVLLRPKEYYIFEKCHELKQNGNCKNKK